MPADSLRREDPSHSCRTFTFIYTKDAKSGGTASSAAADFSAAAWAAGGPRRAWSATETAQLMEAHRRGTPGSPSFWETVAAHLPGRDATECADQFFAAHPSPSRGKRKRSIMAPRASREEEGVADDLPEGFVDHSPWRPGGDRMAAAATRGRAAGHGGRGSRGRGRGRGRTARANESLWADDDDAGDDDDDDDDDGLLRPMTKAQREEISAYARKLKVRKQQPLRPVRSRTKADGTATVAAARLMQQAASGGAAGGHGARGSSPTPTVVEDSDDDAGDDDDEDEYFDDDVDD